MIKVGVVVKGLDNLFSMERFNESLSKEVRIMAEGSKNFWFSIAGKRLKSSRIEYQKAIKLEGITSDTFDLILDGGFLPSAVEIGTDPYPMNVPKGKIVPLNVHRQIIFTSPQVWRTGVGEPWKHPGFPGFNMREDVVEELLFTLLPRSLDEILSRL